MGSDSGHSERSGLLGHDAKYMTVRAVSVNGLARAKRQVGEVARLASCEWVVLGVMGEVHAADRSR